jgi:hypothetical protein
MSAHILMIVVRDTGSVHAHDGRIDHPRRRVMSGDQRIHDAVRAGERLSEHDRPGAEFAPGARNCIVA